MSQAAREVVVLVDDDETMLDMLSRYLRAKGFEVIATSSAIGVGALVLRHHPIAIVLDVMMPALDGEGLARLLRAQPATKEVGIVLHSALPPEQLAALAARIGRASYVAKGTGLSALHEAIRAMPPHRG
jgi:DNA-binding response OmpR family regulator